MMKKEQFLSSKQLKLNLLSIERKGMQLHHRYVIEVITDKGVEQVRKKFKQFQKFNKILESKLGMKDKEFQLSKYFRTNNNYAQLQTYIERLNSGYLIYKTSENGNGDGNKNFDYFSNTVPTKNVMHFQPARTKQLRNYLFGLLFGENEDGVDEDSQTEIKKEPQKKKVESQISEKITKNGLDQQPKSENDLQPKLNKNGYSFDTIGRNSTNGTINSKWQIIGMNEFKSMENIKPMEKSEEPGGLKKTLKNIANKIVKAVNQKENSPQPNSIILKSITKCWVKTIINDQFLNKNRKKFIWQEFQIKFNDKLIQFTKNKFGNLYHRVFVIYQCQVVRKYDEDHRIIIRSKVDKHPLEIRLSLGKQSEDIKQKYFVIENYIKKIQQLSKQKQSKICEIDRNMKLCNKVRISIDMNQKHGKTSSNELRKMSSTLNTTQLSNTCSKQNLTSQKLIEEKSSNEISNNIKFFTIKVIHGCIQAIVTLKIDSCADIDLPIVNNFGNVEIRVYQVVKETKGYFSLRGSKDPLDTYNILVQTIYHCMYNRKTPDLKQGQLKSKIIEIKQCKINLNFDYKCISSYYAWCSSNSNDILEQDQPAEQFSKDEYRMNNNRLKRITWSIQLYAQTLKDLINFTYPNFSYLFYIFVAVCCMFYDNNNFFIWIVISLLMILIYNYPLFGIYMKEIKNMLKGLTIRKKIVRLLYQKNVMIVEQFVILKKKQEKREFLEKFQLTRKIKRSIFKKYKRILYILLQIQIVLTKIVSIIQKIKNLFVWYHYKKTLLFFCILVGILFFIFILPVRIILCVFVIKEMLKKRNYHQNVQNENRKIIRRLVQKIVKDNNLNNIQPYIQKQLLKFNSQSDDLRIFYRLIDSSLSEWLSIKIRMDEVQNKSKCMDDLLTNLSKCKQRYRIKRQINDKYRLNIQEYKKESSMFRYLELIYGFVITIPSDKIILGVKTINTANKEQEQEEEEEDENLE